MNTELYKAYEDMLWMLEDGVRKTPEDCWRSGPDDYLIPARIAYHIIKGLEYLVNPLPREEFLRTRRYHLNWLGTVENMPGRGELLSDLDWIRGLVMDWLVQPANGDPAGQRVETALYHLRHAQHHLGEYGIIARLSGFPEPEWK